MKRNMKSQSIVMLTLGVLGGGSCWSLVYAPSQDEVVTKQLILSDGDGRSGMVLKMSRDGRYLCIASIDSSGNTSSHPLMTIGLDGSLLIARDDGLPLFGIKANRETVELMLGAPGESTVRMRAQAKSGLVELVSGSTVRAQMSVDGTSGTSHITVTGPRGAAGLFVDSDDGALLNLADSKMRPLATVGASGNGSAGMSLYDRDDSNRDAARAAIGFGSRRNGGAVLEMRSGHGGSIVMRADKSSAVELKEEEGGLARWIAGPDTASLLLRGPGEEQWSWGVDASRDGVRTTIKEGKSDWTVLDASFGDAVLWNAQSRAGETQTIRWPR